MKFEEALDLMYQNEQLTLTGYYYLLTAYRQSLDNKQTEGKV